MKPIDCPDIARWFQQALSAEPGQQPAAAMLEHIAACGRCQGALMLLLAEALGLKQPLAGITCAACEEQLPAFVDLAAKPGLGATARELPEVWLHLWACADCSELYAMVRQAVAAERQPKPAQPSAPPARSSARRPLTHIARALLQVAFPDTPAPFSAASVARGDMPLDIVLDIQEEREPQFFISVQRDKQRRWQVRASVIPPPDGWLILRLGDAQYRAPFDKQGLAIVENIAEDLLIAADGPDLDLSLEADERSDA